MLRDISPTQTKYRQSKRQRARQIAILHAPKPYGSIPSRRSSSAPSSTRSAKKKASSSSTFAPYPYFVDDDSKPSSSILSFLLDRLLSALPASAFSSTSSAINNNTSTYSVLGFMPRSPPAAAPPLDVSLPITIASSTDTATDDACSCLSTSLSSSFESLSSSSTITSSTTTIATCSSCSSIMAASLFLASEDSLSDLLCDRYRQPKEAKQDAADAVPTFRNKLLGPPPSSSVENDTAGKGATATPSLSQAQRHLKPLYRPRDLRVNGAHLRMIVAEANMMRADKIIGPLRPRGSLPKRSDEFLPLKRSHLRYQCN